LLGGATAAFVHAGDVHDACGLVASDLDVADKCAAAGNLMRVPSETVVGGNADEEGAPANSEVVPGDVHVPIEWAGRVVVGPTRLSVGAAFVENAIVDPASRGG